MNPRAVAHAKKIASMSETIGLKGVILAEALIDDGIVDLYRAKTAKDVYADDLSEAAGLPRHELRGAIGLLKYAHHGNEHAERELAHVRDGAVTAWSAYNSLSKKKMLKPSLSKILKKVKGRAHPGQKISTPKPSARPAEELRETPLPAEHPTFPGAIRLRSGPDVVIDQLAALSAAFEQLSKEIEHLISRIDPSVRSDFADYLNGSLAPAVCRLRNQFQGERQGEISRQQSRKRTSLKG